MRPLQVTLAVIGTFQLVLGLLFLVRGDVTLRQVTAASCMPAVFVGALIWLHPRRHSTGAEIATSSHDAASLDTAR